MGCQPLRFQEPLESMQINSHEAHPSSSCEIVSLNPQKIVGAFSNGIGCIQQYNQPTQCPNGQNWLSENSTEKIEQGWHRIKWSDDMVRILISAVSYFGDVASFEVPENERSQMKGKWRYISKTMVERCYAVSPQQCEDKFNDLNKKYKRLNNLLRTNATCDVVENPTLMEAMNIPEEAKEEVRKILACKQVFYKEMHSYHNKNRRSLPHDENLEESVLVNLKGIAKYCSQDSIDGMPMKRQKHGEDNGVSNRVDTHRVVPEAVEEHQGLREWMISRSLEMEEKRVQIQEQRLELERKKFKWLRFLQMEDEELHKMKQENEVMKLENERLDIEIKCRERGYASE